MKIKRFIFLRKLNQITFIPLSFDKLNTTEGDILLFVDENNNNTLSLYNKNEIITLIEGTEVEAK